MTLSLVASVGIAILVMGLDGRGVRISPELLIVAYAITSDHAVWTTKRSGNQPMHDQTASPISRYEEAG
jgi:hypothetical protein